MTNTPVVRSTRTYVELALSPAAYAEIADKLRAAGYDHAFGQDGAIDLHGLAAVVDGGAAVTPAPKCDSDHTGPACADLECWNGGVPRAELQRIADFLDTADVLQMPDPETCQSVGKWLKQQVLAGAPRAGAAAHRCSRWFNGQCLDCGKSRGMK